MRDDIAKLVHRVITDGLRLKERLDRNERADFDVEQSRLKAHFGDVNFDPGASLAPRPGYRPGEGDRKMQDVQYALASWLDEIFILDSPWSSSWNEHKLEQAFFRTSLRAESFWERADQASGDALEVFYLCVMLGFRGKWQDHPEELKAWRKKIEPRLETGRSSAAPVPSGEKPPTDVPPLRGRDRLQGVIIAVAVALGLLIPAASFFLVYQLK